LAKVHKAIVLIQWILADHAKNRDAALGMSPALRHIRRTSQSHERRPSYLAFAAVARPEVVLRLVQAADELGPVALLSAELTEWARERTLADYEVDLEFESEEGLF
jgi:hypothetical protein